MNEINPFNDANHPDNINAGAVRIESERAIAEARGQIQIAKMFPRSVSQAIAEIQEVAKNREFAEAAFYTVPNRGSGPSIRFAEEVARVYGNFQYGHRELSRSDGRSEIEVYAWDVEKNNISKRQITVEHVRDTKQGSYPLRDQADIDNRIANIAAKQMRGRILALVPKSLVAICEAECKRTLAGNGEGPTVQQRIARMISAFAAFGVKPTHINQYLGHDLDDATMDDIADLQGIFTALRDGARVSDYFSAPDRGQQHIEQGEASQPGEQEENKDSKLGSAGKGASKSKQTGRQNKPAPEKAEEKQAEPEKKEPAKRSKPAKNEPEPEPEPPEANEAPEANQAPAGQDDDELF